jgi:translation initiation factor IF-2
MDWMHQCPAGFKEWLDISVDGAKILKLLWGGRGVGSMEEVKVGEVVKFFAKPGVAAIVITDGVLREGDTIRIKGHTSDFTQVVESMQINNQSVTEAKVGDDVGIKTAERARPGDIAYKVVES